LEDRGMERVAPRIRKLTGNRARVAACRDALPTQAASALRVARHGIVLGIVAGRLRRRRRRPHCAARVNQPNLHGHRDRRLDVRELGENTADRNGFRHRSVIDHRQSSASLAPILNGRVQCVCWEADFKFCARATRPKVRRASAFRAACEIPRARAHPRS
jgi:hypothetical protein